MRTTDKKRSLLERAHFPQVALLSANLSVDEEGYPSGPNFMFYHLFGKEHLRQRLRPYSHAFWIEWDVQPVRALWIDSVVELASGTACCWMSGSPYVGRGLDSAVTNPKNSPWLFHLNGNALYELHNEEFTQFLELVKEREPPGHYWWVPQASAHLRSSHAARSKERVLTCTHVCVYNDSVVERSNACTPSLQQYALSFAIVAGTPSTLQYGRRSLPSHTRGTFTRRTRASFALLASS